MAYRGLGDTGKAEAHAQQRGDSRPGFLPDPLMQQIEELLQSAQAYEFRGTEAIDKGEWSAAAVYLRKGVELAPNNSSVRLKLAEALRRSGRPEESLLYYEQAVQIDPGVAGARFGYAMALVRLRRYQEARDRLVEGMRIHAGQPAFPQALARLLASAPDTHVRDGRRALALTHELLKRDQSTELGATMAMTLAELGQFEEAAALQRQLISAVQRSGREDLVRIMIENLRLYERREACRTPWPDDAIP
jgi:tetratricopeptide (TPR) repeat protein